MVDIVQWRATIGLFNSTKSRSVLIGSDDIIGLFDSTKSRSVLIGTDDEVLDNSTTFNHCFSRSVLISTNEVHYNSQTLIQLILTVFLVYILYLFKWGCRD